MSFTPVNVKDRIVQYPGRYSLTPVSGTTYDLVQVPGTITEPGTDVNKALLQPIEDSISGLADYQAPTSVIGQVITLTTGHTNSRCFIKIASTITGGAITIARDGGASKPLLNPDGSVVDELSIDTKYFEVVEETTNFTLAPKGGSNIKSIQHGTTIMTGAIIDILINEIDITKSVVFISFKVNSASNTNISTGMVASQLTTPTNLQLIVNTFTNGITVSWTVVEYNRLKSKQVGITSMSSTTFSLDVIVNSIDKLKSILIYTFTVSDVADAYRLISLVGGIASNTTINFLQIQGTKNIYWQLLEFD